MTYQTFRLKNQSFSECQSYRSIVLLHRSCICSYIKPNIYLKVNCLCEMVSFNDPLSLNIHQDKKASKIYTHQKDGPTHSVPRLIIHSYHSGHPYYTYVDWSLLVLKICPAGKYWQMHRINITLLQIICSTLICLATATWLDPSLLTHTCPSLFFSLGE